MAMGRRKRELQETMFITIADLPSTAGHPFYEKLNEALRAMAFDRRVESACQLFYHEKLERSNAHLYETDGMRHTHLRGHANILKRLIVHAAGFNLGLLMRALLGIGKPRTLQDAPRRLWAALRAYLHRWMNRFALLRSLATAPMPRGRQPMPHGDLRLAA